MSTIRTYLDRPMVPALYHVPAVLRLPGAAPRPLPSLAAALDLDATPGASIDDGAGAVLAVCGELAPGVWYVPAARTVGAL